MLSKDELATKVWTDWIQLANTNGFPFSLWENMSPATKAIWANRIEAVRGIVLRDLAVYAPLENDLWKQYSDKGLKDISFAQFIINMIEAKYAARALLLHQALDFLSFGLYGIVSAVKSGATTKELDTMVSAGADLTEEILNTPLTEAEKRVEDLLSAVFDLLDESSQVTRSAVIGCLNKLGVKYPV